MLNENNWFNHTKFDIREVVVFDAEKQNKGKVTKEMLKFSKEKIPLLIIDSTFKDNVIFYHCVRYEDIPEGMSKKWYQEDALNLYKKEG